jgi:serine/threonine protein kinase
MASAAFPGRRSPTVQRVADRYELRDVLGEGGMGIVWRALDTKTGSEVAIKIMKDVSDPAALELFTKEWRALAEMSHPNIIDVRDVDVLTEQNERKPFFVMPLLRGSTLAELIKNGSERLTVARMVEIIGQVCRGLHAAHERHLVHRDLKPSNIFVMGDDTAKIIDFGVVYLAGTHSTTGQKGTFQYMSPEQVLMKEVTPASDLFSVGVVLYESLTGRKPFSCPTVEETMQAVLKRMPPPVSELNPSIPHAVSQVIHKCLAKQPIHRFSSARELADYLTRASRNEEIFDRSKLKLRIDRAKTALKGGDDAFASELLSELESEGHLDPDVRVLRTQIDVAMKQKKIRQLMESARARIEQDEIPLGLDKLREVLELDPENTDALALRRTSEKKRSEAQAEKWLQLANTHLDNRDFSAARQAVQEALASKHGDPSALALLGHIDAIESEAKRIRDQKEQLYNTAMKAYQNGEIDTALSRLVRLFSVVRSKPEGAVPERDAVYESFYKEVRSQHDAIHSVLEEAQHLLSEENFAQALALCVQHLATYPNDGAFQALKIQIEDAERQTVSAYIATVSKNVDAEPDLDRRANILREACERYPNEMQFAQQLKIVRERRDLVNSIVAKAHQFAEREQYDEELSQWDILRNIHPRYPGLAFELEQCRRKRDLAAQDENKGRLVDEIVGLMDARAFDKALERTKLALLEFPTDVELVGLEKLCLDGQKRARESERLFETGRSAYVERDWTTADTALRKALQLDSRNTVVRDLLINVLTDQARELVDSDWKQAADLHQSARELDENHRAVRSLGIAVSEARRLPFVGECLTEARSLVAEGKPEAAYECIQRGRKEYPKDARLEQFESQLLRDSKVLLDNEARNNRRRELVEARHQFERNPNSEKARQVLKLSEGIRAENPDNPQANRDVADTELLVKRVIGTDDLSTLLRSDSDATGRHTVRVTANANRHSSTDDADGVTKVFIPGAQKVRSQKSPSDVGTRWIALRLAVRRTIAEIDFSSTKVRIGAIVLGVMLLTIIAVLLFVRMQNRRLQPTQSAHTPAPTSVHIFVETSDISLKVDGKIRPAGVVSVPAGGVVTIEASRLGYQTKSFSLNSNSPSELHVILDPEPMRISVSTAGHNGSVELDGHSIGELTDGSLDGIDVPSDGNGHTLGLVVNGRHVASFQVLIKPGQRPVLEPITARDMIVVSSLGSSATIYGGEQLQNVAMGQNKIVLKNSGTDLPPISEEQNQIDYKDGSEAGSLTIPVTSWPLLELRSLGAGSQILITSEEPTASLTANNDVVFRGKKGWRINKPGTYNFVLSADGFESKSWRVDLGARQSLSQNIKLDRKAAEVTTSVVSIYGGTPGARLELDGKLAGELDGNGTFEFSGGLSAGRHTVEFRRDGLCTSRPYEFPVLPPFPVHLQVNKLDPCGTITLQTNTQGDVKARHTGDLSAKWIYLTPGKKIQVPSGTYQIQASIQGSKPYDAQISVEAGQNTEVDPKYVPLQTCAFQSAADGVSSADGLKAKGGDKTVYLTAGCLNVNVSFDKPKGGFLGLGRKLHWEVGTSSGARLEYEFEDGKVSRKVDFHHIFDAKTLPAQNLIDAKTGSIQIRIRTDNGHIRITNETGAVIDDYISQDPGLHDLSGGKLGFRSNAPFTVRSNP